MRIVALRFALLASLLGATAGGLWGYAGSYGFNVLIRHGGSYWINVPTDNLRLSESMRLALLKDPLPEPGKFTWRTIEPGFDVAELTAVVGQREVDRIELARIDPARFRFTVQNAPSGEYNIDSWTRKLGAALIVNGSYYGHDGRPVTPLISDGRELGPQNYQASGGAFIASSRFTGVSDLAKTDWKTALKGADNAMVSYPLLLSPDGSRVPQVSHWLANSIVIGTTRDAFFSLSRLAEFLPSAPLDLKIALNLDGGPVACQSIAFDGYERKTYGRWEFELNGGRASFLTWLYGKAVSMPIVLAVYRK